MVLKLLLAEPHRKLQMQFALLLKINILARMVVYIQILHNKQQPRIYNKLSRAVV